MTGARGRRWIVATVLGVAVVVVGAVVARGITSGGDAAAGPSAAVAAQPTGAPAPALEPTTPAPSSAPPIETPSRTAPTNPPAEPAEPAAPGTLQLVILPRSATLEIDGKRIPTTRGRARVELVPGEHAIRVTAAGFRPWVEELTVTSAVVTPVKVRLRRQERTRATPDTDGVVNPFARKQGR